MTLEGQLSMNQRADAAELKIHRQLTTPTLDALAHETQPIAFTQLSRATFRGVDESTAVVADMKLDPAQIIEVDADCDSLRRGMFHRVVHSFSDHLVQVFSEILEDLVCDFTNVAVEGH